MKPITDWQDLWQMLRENLLARMPFIRCAYLPARRFKNSVFSHDREELILNFNDRLGDYFYMTFADTPLQYDHYHQQSLAPDGVIVKIPFRFVSLTHERNGFQMEAWMRTLFSELSYGNWAEGTVGIHLEQSLLQPEAIFTQETGIKQSFPAFLEEVNLFACNGTLLWETTVRSCALSTEICPP